MGKTCLFRILAGSNAAGQREVLVLGGKPVTRGMVGVVAKTIRCSCIAR